MGRRVRGNFKSLLKRLPESVAVEIRTQLNETGKQLLAKARSRAPVYHGRPKKGVVPGALRAALSYKVPPKSLRLRVGLVGKPINRKIYYGRWQEFGWRPYRKNRARKLQPLTERGYKPGTAAYRLAALSRQKQRVPPRHYVYTTSRDEIYRPFQKIWGRAIHRAATGATDE